MLAGTQFAHVGFTTKLPWYLRLGTTTHILGRWRAADALACIAEHRIPSLGGVAPQIALLLREDLEAYDLTCVQDDRHGRRRLAASHGAGGDGPASTPPTRSATRPPRAAGAAPAPPSTPTTRRRSSPSAGPAAASRSASATTRPGPLPDGEVGEVWLRSPTTMSELLARPEATAHALTRDWLRTGDLGFIDERGCLRLAGRLKEMFIRGGYNVYPARWRRCSPTTRRSPTWPSSPAPTT